MKHAFAGLILIFFLGVCSKDSSQTANTPKDIKPLRGIPASATDWPRFLGPLGTSRSPVKNINKNWARKRPRILWKQRLHDDGYTGPSAAAGKIFIQDHIGKNEVVRAFSISSGKEVWRFSYPDPGRPNFGYSRTTPTYDEGRLYTLSRFGMLHCLNAETGKKIWSMHIVKKFHGRVSEYWLSISPIIDGKRLIVCPSGEKGVVTLNKYNGSIIWQGGNDDEMGHAIPVITKINGKKRYVMFTGKKLIIIDPKHGNVLWEFKWPTRFDTNAATPLIIGRDRIFITTSYFHGSAMLKVTKHGLQKLWENQNMLGHFSTPIFYKNHIYGTSDPDFLVCINAATGKLRWKKKGFYKGGLIMVDGVMIILAGKKGSLHMFKPDPYMYREISRFKSIGGRSWTAPIIVGRKIIVRNRKYIACVDIGAPGRRGQ